MYIQTVYMCSDSAVRSLNLRASVDYVFPATIMF